MFMKHENIDFIGRGKKKKILPKQDSTDYCQAELGKTINPKVKQVQPKPAHLASLTEDALEVEEIRRKGGLLGLFIFRCKITTATYLFAVPSLIGWKIYMNHAVNLFFIVTRQAPVIAALVILFFAVKDIIECLSYFDELYPDLCAGDQEEVDDCGDYGPGVSRYGVGVSQYGVGVGQYGTIDNYGQEIGRN